jgi:hypothetical protein
MLAEKHGILSFEEWQKEVWIKWEVWPKRVGGLTEIFRAGNYNTILMYKAFLKDPRTPIYILYISYT